MNKNSTSVRRLALLLIALVASSLSLVTVSATSASAAVPTTSHLSATKTVLKYGGSVTVSGYVSSDGVCGPCGPGTVYLQRKAVGTSTWSNFSTRDLSVDPTPSWTFKPTKSTYYRLYFPGYSDQATGSVSPAVKVSVARNLHDNFRRSTRTFYGKVAPRYAGRAVVIQKSTCARPATTSCRWSTFKTIRTTSTSNFSLRLPAYRTKTHFRAVIAASNGYVKSFSNYYVSTWRS